MRGECQREEALLDHRAGGLDEAQLLVLKLHLSRCASCVRTVNMMRAMTKIMERAAPSLSPRIRERALAAAFVRAATVPPRAPSAPAARP